MQELAGDLRGEGRERHRLLLSIKESMSPNPGAECCVHARYRCWSSYSTCDWCDQISRRPGDDAWPSQRSQLFCVGTRFTRNLMVAGFLYVNFVKSYGTKGPIGPHCAVRNDLSDHLVIRGITTQSLIK